MKSVLLALALFGLTANTAEAGSKAKATTHAKAKAKATSHAKAKPKAKAKAKARSKSYRHAHAKPAGRVYWGAPNRHVHVPRPAPPRHAHGSHVVYFHNGHWVRTHRNPLFMWKWNHVIGRWTVVVRF